MEGVLVSANKAGSNITVTVVTDADGRYSFPASRLAPGQYTLAIRAVGYELDQRRADVDIAAEKTATADLKLRKTEDLAAQLVERANGSPASPAPTSRRANCSIASAATRSSASCARPTTRTNS